MKNKSHLARTAGSAIAAALALSSTPLLAQQADPTVQTNAQTAPASQPTTTQVPVFVNPVLPSATPTVTTSPSPTAVPSTSPSPTMRSNPVVQAIPEPEPAEEAVETPSAAASAAPSTRAATTPQPQPQPRAANTNELATTAAPVTETAAAPAVAAEETLPEFVEPTASGEPATPVETTANSDGFDSSWLLGGLGAVGLLLLSLLLFRRRGTPPKAERIKPYQAPKAAPPAPTPEPATVPATTLAGDGAVTTRVEPAAVVNVSPIERTPVARSAAPAGLATAGASVALPRKKPETIAERKALIDRLAAAKPDRANPFKSPKARRRRARLIVQSLDREFKNGSRIDLSQYPANWPHLARRSDTVVA